VSGTQESNNKKLTPAKRRKRPRSPEADGLLCPMKFDKRKDHKKEADKFYYKSNKACIEAL
jgi:hypothetical protein